MNRKKYLIIAGIVVAAVILAILLDAMLANHMPVISSLEAEPDKVFPWQSCQIICNASDADADELSYNWSASGGVINGDSDTVTWTAPGSAGSYNISVTVTDGRRGEVMKQITITVLRLNVPPFITSLVADVDWTRPSSPVQVTCNASDPDGDELSYEWTATGGDISETDNEVIWTAPEQVGSYNITVVVSDGYGGEDTRKLSLSVNLGNPPTIEKLVVTPNGNNKYLRKSTTPGCDCDVWINKEYDIECIVSDKGELVYEWSCDDGEISEVSEDGATITWTAPNEKSVDVTITIIVADAYGNSIANSAIFHVASCTCGIWELELLEIPF